MVFVLFFCQRSNLFAAKPDITDFNGWFFCYHNFFKLFLHVIFLFFSIYFFYFLQISISLPNLYGHLLLSTTVLIPGKYRFQKCHDFSWLPLTVGTLRWLMVSGVLCKVIVFIQNQPVSSTHKRSELGCCPLIVTAPQTGRCLLFKEQPPLSTALTSPLFSRAPRKTWASWRLHLLPAWWQREGKRRTSFLHPPFNLRATVKTIRS